MGGPPNAPQPKKVKGFARSTRRVPKCHCRKDGTCATCCSSLAPGTLSPAWRASKLQRTWTNRARDSKPAFILTHWRVLCNKAHVSLQFEMGMHAWLHLYVHIHIHTLLYIHIYVCVYVCIYGFQICLLYTHIYTCVHLCIFHIQVPRASSNP